jgi:Protein of unknown function (DUF1552)
MKNTISRRSLFQSIVGATAAEALMRLTPHAAFAQGATPRRLLVVFHPMGYLDNSFWPKGELENFELGETQKALEPYKSKLLYLNGVMKADRPQWVDFETRKQILDNEHGSGINGIFTGSKLDVNGEYAVSASIDQVVAEHVYRLKPTPYKSIDLSAFTGGGGHGSAFFTAPRTPVKPMRTAKLAWDTLFSQLQIQPGAMVDNSAFLRTKAQKQRIIDNTRAEFKAICDRVGAEEKRMCESHLSGISELEGRIKALDLGVQSAGCTKPATPVAGDPTAEIRARIDLIQASFSCNLSSVATLQIGGADGGVDVAGLANQHGTTHATGDSPSPTVYADHKKWDSWWAGHWAYLLKQLSSVQEGNGTLLDNTLILFGSDTTTSTDLKSGNGAHQSHRFPMWFAGGSNFAFKTGRNIVMPYPPIYFQETYRYGGMMVSNNQMLVSVARAMGLDINAFGSWDFGKGAAPLT